MSQMGQVLSNSKVFKEDCCSGGKGVGVATKPAGCLGQAKINLYHKWSCGCGPYAGPWGRDYHQCS